MLGSLFTRIVVNVLLRDYTIIAVSREKKHLFDTLLKKNFFLWVPMLDFIDILYTKSDNY